MTPKEEIQAVRKVIDAADGGPVGKWNHIRDLARLPIGYRRIMNICRKYAKEWGYTYIPAEYIPSGSGTFGRLSSKRGRYDVPYMVKR